MKDPEEAEVELRVVQELQAYLDKWEDHLKERMGYDVVKIAPAMRNNPTTSTSLNEGTLDALAWTTHAKGFDWIFNRARDNSQIPNTALLAAEISKAPQKKLDFGRFTYTMSIDGKFIQRRKKE
jgi:hypothetical protein